MTAGCATAPQQAETKKPKEPYKAAEVMIDNPEVAQTAPFIIRTMTEWGFRLAQSSDYLLVFERESTDVLTSAIYGSRFNSTPVSRVTYTLVPIQNQLQVLTDVKMVTNPGSAYESATTIRKRREARLLQALLDNVKSQVEGTAVAEQPQP